MNTQFDLFPAWPSSMIETLDSCPICESKQSSILHQDVSDHLFGVPGTWTICRCRECNVAYLNPRLAPEAIGEAYRRYYTHEGKSSSKKNSFRRFVADAYAVHRLGATRTPHLAWSEIAAKWVFPGIAKHLNAQYRYLPRARRGATLLDVGCGNGDFLLKVLPLGWNATGLEFDPQAHALALSRNLSVIKGAVPGSGLPDESYDAITLYHVIEHVHDPRTALIELFRLLKPGGTISLTTPNCNSYGANLYGRYWRGLEPPRHLVLFTPSALLGLAGEVGFIQLEAKVQPESAHFYFRQSREIAETATGGLADFLPDPNIEVERACAISQHDSSLAEEFTIVGIKPTA